MMYDKYESVQLELSAWTSSKASPFNTEVDRHLSHTSQWRFHTMQHSLASEYDASHIIHRWTALPVGSGNAVIRRILAIYPHLKNPCRLTNFCGNVVYFSFAEERLLRAGRGRVSWPFNCWGGFFPQECGQAVQTAFTPSWDPVTILAREITDVIGPMRLHSECNTFVHFYKCFGIHAANFCWPAELSINSFHISNCWS